MQNQVSPKSRCKAQKQIQSSPETILRVCHIVLLDQPTLSAKSKFIKGILIWAFCRIDLKICNSRFTQLLKPAWEIKVYQKHLGHLRQLCNSHPKTPKSQSVTNRWMDRHIKLFFFMPWCLKHVGSFIQNLKLGGYQSSMGLQVLC